MCKSTPLTLASPLRPLEQQHPKIARFCGNTKGEIKRSERTSRYGRFLFGSKTMPGKTRGAREGMSYDLRRASLFKASQAACTGSRFWAHSHAKRTETTEQVLKFNSCQYSYGLKHPNPILVATLIYLWAICHGYWTYKTEPTVHVPTFLLLDANMFQSPVPWRSDARDTWFR